MDENLPQPILDFVSKRKTCNPLALVQGEKLEIIKLPAIDIPSLEKFYSMVSSVILRPNLVDPKIYDTRKVSAKATYGQRPFMNLTVEQRIDAILDKHLTPEDLQLIREVTLRQVVLIRQIFKRDCSSYYLLECWDFVLHTVRVFPVDRVMGHVPFRKDYIYCMAFENSQFLVHCGVFDEESEAMANKFLHTFGAKLQRWAKEPVANADNFKVFPRSNSMVQPIPYMETYDNLKKTHYTKLCQIWDQLGNKTLKEREKDIHEDLAIATYLHVAFRDLAMDFTGILFKSFVDLGCGNGLLTYLLTNLGWDGYGIDCRRRRLWDALGQAQPLRGGKKQKKSRNRKQDKDDDETVMEKKADLRELIINPNETQFTKDTTRIFIGNHPDELTPWIPVLARKTQSHFIIIPCCPFKFDGSKFQNKQHPKKEKLQQGIKKQAMKQWNRNRQSPCEVYDEMVDEMEDVHDETDNKEKEAEEEKGEELSPNSTYQQYLAFINSIATECGYTTFIDRLRIPSTKRVAIFGILEGKLQKLRLEESEFWEDIQLGMNWFKPPKIPRVVNCTALCRQDVERVVSLIFKYLLGESTIEDNYFFDEGYKRMWNRGCQNTGLKTIIHCVLDAKDRKIFKDQAKGLQTLIKNHRHIFRFNKGCVVLRVPTCNDAANVKDKSLLHTKACYFYANHPRGCPLPDELCAFRHDGVSSVDKNIKEGEPQDNDSANADFDQNMNEVEYQEYDPENPGYFANAASDRNVNQVEHQEYYPQNPDYSANADSDRNMNEVEHQEYDPENPGYSANADSESNKNEGEHQDTAEVSAESQCDSEKTYEERGGLSTIWEEDEDELEEEEKQVEEELEAVADLNESFRSSNTDGGVMSEDDVIDLSEVALFKELRIR